MFLLHIFSLKNKNPDLLFDHPPFSTNGCLPALTKPARFGKRFLAVAEGRHNGSIVHLIGKNLQPASIF
jgi:hypothetical protein